MELINTLINMLNKFGDFFCLPFHISNPKGKGKIVPVLLTENHAM